MRIDSSSVTISPTDDPAIFIVSGRATDDPETITNDQKNWYPFELRWNQNRPAKEFSTAVSEIIDSKKPKASVSNLKSTLISANKKILVDMTGEEPTGGTP